MGALLKAGLAAGRMGARMVRAAVDARWHSPRLVWETVRSHALAKQLVAERPFPEVLQQMTPKTCDRSWSVSAVGRFTELLLRYPSPLTSTCLYRTLTRYSLLRRAGYPVVVHIGLERPLAGSKTDLATNPERIDLQGHAWLELNGKVLFETLDADYVVTYRYPDKFSA